MAVEGLEEMGSVTRRQGCVRVEVGAAQAGLDRMVLRQQEGTVASV